MENQVWEAAEFEAEWDHNELRYKLFTVPRDAVDEDSDESAAHLLISLDSGNVRREDIILDTAYGREIAKGDLATIADAIQSAPPSARSILAEYLGA